MLRPRVLVLVVSLLALVVSGLQVGTAAPSAEAATLRTYTYQVCRAGTTYADFAAFRRSVNATLADSRGWSRASVRFVERPARCSSLSATSFTVYLASPAYIDRFVGCSAAYSCRVGKRVLINDRRWRLGTTTYGKDLAGYRVMVTNHEVGHWLGQRHRTARCTSSTQLAPVMMQQSISLRGCRRNPWPLSYEIRSVLVTRP